MDEKIKELIAIGASVATNCQPCLTHHVDKAYEVDIWKAPATFNCKHGRLNNDFKN